jgi:PAS domain S-box-containing protein
MTLADLIERQRESITERWLAQVQPLAPRPDLTREQLVDSLPDFLSELVRALRHLDDASVTSSLPDSSPVGEVHGAQRHALGYTAGPVAREYPLLQEVILLVAAASGVRVRATETVLLARCMGTATSEALSHFFTVHEKALRRRAVHAQARQVLAEDELQRVQDAEARARDSQERLRRVVEASGTATWELDLATGEVSDDARHVELLGLPPGSKVTLQRILEGMHPEDRAPTERAIAAAVAGEGGGRYHVELRTRRADGASWRWLEGRGQVLFDAEGRPARLVGTTLDVSLRKEAEARARESEARYRDLFSTIDDGFCVIQVLFDAEGRPADYRFLEANGAFERQTGLTSVVGRAVRELVPGLEAHFFELYGRVATTGEPARFESHAPSMGRWFDAYATRIGPPEERQVAVVFKDVTERKRLEAEAQAERQKLYDVFQQAPAFIAILEGPEYTFTFVNPAYRRLVGGRDVVGKSLREALPEVEAQGFRQMLDGVLATGAPFLGTAVPLKLPHHGEGEVDYVSFVYQPMRDAAGAVRGILACGYTVTEQVLARQASERLAQEAELRADFEQKLIGIVGHDLRQPLQTVSMSAQVLLARKELDERSHRAVTRILSATERAGRMLRDILDFTQARLGGGIPLSREQADLALVARGAADEAMAAQPERRVEVEVEGDGHGRWDVDRLHQVLDNLLTNALTYGAREAPVRLTVDGRGEEAVVLSVHNAGAPIPPELLPDLFAPMKRGAAPSGARRSVGLGLFIVQHLVQAHGGTIEVESSEGAGTTFTVRLPRREPPARSASA